MDIVSEIKKKWPGTLPPFEKHGLLYLPAMSDRALTLVKEFQGVLMVDCGNLAINLPVEGLELIVEAHSITLKNGDADVGIRC